MKWERRKKHHTGFLVSVGILACIVLLFLIFEEPGKTESDGTILVCVTESESVSAYPNGQRISPGDDAEFILTAQEGKTVLSADYGGSYKLVYRDDSVLLRLENVRFPTRVSVEATENAKKIRYDPNGGTDADGTEKSVTLAYSTAVHSRPNTSTGSELFTREGYTLVSWNTCADGSGQRIGLGSRVTVSGDTLTLYAQWEKWTPESEFRYTIEDGQVFITEYLGNADIVAVPEKIEGFPVAGINSGAFLAKQMKEAILPPTVLTVEENAFKLCELETLVLFDSIETISDDSFVGCSRLKTLLINAVEPPYGYSYRRESLLADKVDLLIEAAGTRKLVCYGGCAMWYNLDGEMMQEHYNDQFRVINLGLNGTVNSLLQMEIILHYMEPGDVLLHTPEISSREQLMLDVSMDEYDDKLWCGLEYNYDLLQNVDISDLNGIFSSLCEYLGMKQEGGTYADEYRDSHGKSFLDTTGCIPFDREEPAKNFGTDAVYLDPEYLEKGLPGLGRIYESFTEKGIQVLVSYACVNIDSVPESQQGNVEAMDALFANAIAGMNGPQLISSLPDYVVHGEDMYDTNYHLLSEMVKKNTSLWIRDLDRFFAS